MWKQHPSFSAALSALRLSGVTLACLGSLASVQSAQAATLASGQASLTGIRYELIDLAPDDGETPWIRFENDDGSALNGLADATGLSHLDNVAQTAGWQGLLPAQAVQTQSLDGLSAAQAGPNSLSTSFSVDASVLNQMQPLGDGSGRSQLNVFSQVRTGNGIASLAYDFDEATGQVTALDGETGWRPLDFTLSAHTALVIHADASAQVSIDPSQGSWDIRNPGGYSADEPMIGSGVQIALLMLRPGFTMQTSYASFDDFYADMDQAYQLSFDGLSADWTPDDLATMTPNSRSLQVMLSNDSSLQTRGNLLMTGMSQFAVSQTAVPEPTSGALMALGLIGGLAVWTRQRHQAGRTAAA